METVRQGRIRVLPCRRLAQAAQGATTRYQDRVAARCHVYLAPIRLKVLQAVRVAPLAITQARRRQLLVRLALGATIRYREQVVVMHALLLHSLSLGPVIVSCHAPLQHIIHLKLAFCVRRDSSPRFLRHRVARIVPRVYIADRRGCLQDQYALQALSPFLAPAIARRALPENINQAQSVQRA